MTSFPNIISKGKSRIKALWLPIPNQKGVMLAAIRATNRDIHTALIYFEPLQKVGGAGLEVNSEVDYCESTFDKSFQILLFLICLFLSKHSIIPCSYCIDSCMKKDKLIENALIR